VEGSVEDKGHAARACRAADRTATVENVDAVEVCFRVRLFVATERGGGVALFFSI
jgi:hypothetical protein